MTDVEREAYQRGLAAGRRIGMRIVLALFDAFIREGTPTMSPTGIMGVKMAIRDVKGSIRRGEWPPKGGSE